jgi:hypothetical protein
MHLTTYISRQLLLTFFISLTLYLLWTFTSLKEHHLPSPWSVDVDGRCYIVTAYTFISFIIIFYKNVKTRFNNVGDLKLLVLGAFLLLLWLFAFYWIRLQIISLMLMLMGSPSTIWEFTAADLFVYLPILGPLGLILYVFVRLKKLRQIS